MYLYAAFSSFNALSSTSMRLASYMHHSPRHIRALGCNDSLGQQKITSEIENNNKEIVFKLKLRKINSKSYRHFIDDATLSVRTTHYVYIDILIIIHKQTYVGCYGNVTKRKITYKTYSKE